MTQPSHWAAIVRPDYIASNTSSTPVSREQRSDGLAAQAFREALIERAYYVIQQLHRGNEVKGIPALPLADALRELGSRLGLEVEVTGGAHEAQLTHHA